MRKTVLNSLFLLFVGLILLISVWGPEVLAGYKDRYILEQPHTEAVEEAGAGYRYTLSSNEKLYIIAQCLNSQIMPESDLSALTREEEPEPDYQESDGTYAFVINHRGPTGKEITNEEIFATCNRELAVLKEKGMLPEEIREVEQSSYNAVLYSAIDVLEPRNSVPVWKLSLADSQQNYDRANRILDVYLDADNGKIYEIYARSPQTWEEMDPDGIMEIWREYMGLREPEAYETANPLLEVTPFFKKYVFAGMGDDRTVVTIGFFEGINELFLKITG